jgi:hypothetical protein
MKKLLVLGLSLAATSAWAECKKIEGAPGLLNQGALILVGAQPNTKEIPQVFAELVCHGSKKNLPMLIGLELPAPEQGPVEKFLNSGDRTELLNSPPFKKGRVSAAMVELLERLRALRTAGARFRMVLFDAQPGDPSLRPLLMSRPIAAARASDKNDLMLVLSDVGQATLAPGTMATKLKESKINFTSLQAVEGKPGAKVSSVNLDPKLGTFSGTISVGPVTQSPPATAGAQ